MKKLYEYLIFVRNSEASLPQIFGLERKMSQSTAAIRGPVFGMKKMCLVMVFISV
jgi:hypothetical protein